MNLELAKLRKQLAANNAAALAILNGADPVTQALSADAELQFQQLSSENASLQTAISRREAVLATQAVVVETTAFGEGARTHDRKEDDKTGGFKSFGEFAQVVKAAAVSQGHNTDSRLILPPSIQGAAPSTYGNEGAGADGGFLVPPTFSTDIFMYSIGGQALLPYTDNTVVAGNSMVFPKDETTPWGTDGIRAYWQAEASAATATKPALSTTTLRTKKLMALVPVTDELLADANALEGYITKKSGESIRWKTDEAILFGTGNGTPLGAMNGNAVITVSKDSGQGSNTLSALNCANMISQLPEGSYSRAVWLVHPTVLPSLFTLTLGNYPIYLPINQGVQSNPYGMLLGRPVIVTQHAKAFSSQADVMLLDLSFYRTITKAGGIETATSMHLYFDADATAFRMTFRLDGQPSVVNPIAPYNGSTDLSPFLQLQAR